MGNVFGTDGAEMASTSCFHPSLKVGVLLAKVVDRAVKSARATNHVNLHGEE